MIYEVNDQTRVGESESGHHAGELDLQILFHNKILAIYEAQVLTSLTKTTIQKHIDKVLIKYNPTGVRLIYHVVYAKISSNRWLSFWDNYYSFLDKEYKYPYHISTPLEEIDDVGYTMHHAKIRLSAGGKDISLHFYVVFIK